MRLEVDNSCTTSFLCGIQENGGIVRWDYDRQHKPDLILIVRSRFGESPDIEEISALLNKQSTELLNDRTIDLGSEIACKFVRNIQGMSGVYKVNYTPATYSVYSCTKSDDCIKIYRGQNGKTYRCNVVASIEYRVDNETREVTSGILFNRTRVSYNFSKITIKGTNNYSDGALYYCFEGSEIRFPIGKSMLGQPFYVRWFQNTNHPIIRSQSIGYKAVKR